MRMLRVMRCVAIYGQRKLSTLVLAAKAGADIATVPFKVLERAAKHPLSDKGIEKTS
jgi:transaldolase